MPFRATVANISTYTGGYRGGSNLRGVKYDSRINPLVHVYTGALVGYHRSDLVLISGVSQSILSKAGDSGRYM